MTRFHFSSTPIDTDAGRRALQDGAAGGYVSFEGWVRDHNEGLAVRRLEYEAFVDLAVKEGDRIVAQAMARYPVRHALCVHRIGDLAIGDLAVWVGVSAVHRGEAFDACRSGRRNTTSTATPAGSIANVARPRRDTITIPTHTGRTRTTDRWSRIIPAKLR